MFPGSVWVRAMTTETWKCLELVARSVYSSSHNIQILVLVESIPAVSEGLAETLLLFCNRTGVYCWFRYKKLSNWFYIFDLSADHTPVLYATLNTL